jgi:uncharacterized membrane protein YhaH (DUF805 family)
MDNNNQENPLIEHEQATTRSETAHPFDKQSLGTLNGRMGRLDFAILSFSLYLVTLIIQKMFGVNPFLIGVTAFTDKEIITKELINLGVIINLISLILFVLLSVKRFHDINYSGWMSLIFIAPLINLGILSLLIAFVGFIIRLTLLFAKGEPNKNRFGEIPVGNHRNKLLVFIGIVILTVIMFANTYSEALPIIEPIVEQLLQEMQQQ